MTSGAKENQMKFKSIWNFHKTLQDLKKSLNKNRKLIDKLLRMTKS